jgi:hypothetical protein
VNIYGIITNYTIIMIAISVDIATSSS